MDIEHSDIGFNKHQAIPAFQPVLLIQLKKVILNFKWTTVHKEDEMIGNSIHKENGGEWFFQKQ